MKRQIVSETPPLPLPGYVRLDGLIAQFIWRLSYECNHLIQLDDRFEQDAWRKRHTRCPAYQPLFVLYAKNLPNPIILHLAHGALLHSVWFVHAASFSLNTGGKKIQKRRPILNRNESKTGGLSQLGKKQVLGVGGRVKYIQYLIKVHGQELQGKGSSLRHTVLLSSQELLANVTRVEALLRKRQGQNKEIVQPNARTSMNPCFENDASANLFD